MDLSLKEKSPMAEFCNLRQAVQWIAHDMKPLPLDIELKYRSQIKLMPKRNKFDPASEEYKNFCNEDNAMVFLFEALKRGNVIASGLKADICAPNSGVLWRINEEYIVKGQPAVPKIEKEKTDIPSEFWRELNTPLKGIVEWNESKAIESTFAGTSNGYADISISSSELSHLHPLKEVMQDRMGSPKYETKMIKIIEKLRYEFDQWDEETCIGASLISIAARVKEIEGEFGLIQDLSKTRRELIARMLLHDSNGDY